MVRRIVELLTVPARPDHAPLRLAQIVAITFTERAAEELKDRLRTELFLRLKQALSNVMVSGGERFMDRFESQIWLDHRALDIIQCDCNVTGS